MSYGFDDPEYMNNTGKMIEAIHDSEVGSLCSQLSSSSLGSVAEALHASIPKIDLSPMQAALQSISPTLQQLGTLSSKIAESCAASTAVLSKALEGMRPTYLENMSKVSEAACRAACAYADLVQPASTMIMESIKAAEPAFSLIKRNGELVQFSTQKICDAIRKANEEWQHAEFTKTYVQKAIDTFDLTATLPKFDFHPYLTDAIQTTLASVAGAAQYVAETVAPLASRAYAVLHDSMIGKLAELQSSAFSAAHNVIHWIINHAVRAYHVLRPRPEPRIYLAASQVKVAATLVRAKAKVRERANHKPELLRINLPRIGNKDSGDASDSDNENLILAA